MEGMWRWSGMASLGRGGGGIVRDGREMERGGGRWGVGGGRERGARRRGRRIYIFKRRMAGK